MQQVPVRDPARYRFEKFGMRYGIEVTGKVTLYNLRVTSVDQAVHRAHSRMGTEVCTVSMLLIRHVGLENRCKHRHRCRHYRSVGKARNAQRAHLAPGLRYPHPPYCFRSIRLPEEFVRQFAQPSLLPVRLDVREVLPVYPRCAMIGFTAPVGVLQHVLAIQLVIQQIEPIARRSLRFGL
jgi:hypothetical protein